MIVTQRIIAARELCAKKKGPQRVALRPIALEERVLDYVLLLGSTDSLTSSPVRWP
jgi:hypothetical protein